LKQAFINISNNLDADKKKFDQFFLFRPTDEIPENAFIDIQFEQLTLSFSFTQIHSNAFNSTWNITRDINESSGDSYLCNNPPDYDFYKAFSSLVNLVTVVINLGRDAIHKIPDYAFNNSRQIYLEIFVIDGSFCENCSISRVGDYVFYKLPSMRFIYINDIPIQTISAHAFDFENSSDTITLIDLSSSQLDENCLETGVFQSPSTIMKLVLSIDQYF
jgi:hypothetical protein